MPPPFHPSNLQQSILQPPSTSLQTRIDSRTPRRLIRINLRIRRWVIHARCGVAVRSAVVAIPGISADSIGGTLITRIESVDDHGRIDLCGLPFAGHFIAIKIAFAFVWMGPGSATCEHQR